MDSTFKASLKADIFKSFWAMEIIFPDFTLRLCDAGFVRIGDDLYAAEDATYGRFGSVGQVQDGADDVAARCEITVLAKDAAAFAALTDPEAQVEAKVRVLFGAVNPTTGQCIGAPDEVFAGFLDIPSFIIDRSRWSVTWDCATGQDRALESREGQNLSPAFHKSIWPGEKGLDLVDGVARRVYWNMNEPRGNIGGGRLPPTRPSRPTVLARF